MDKSIQILPTPKYYLLNHRIYEETNTTWLGRKVLNWTGLRDYNLTNIFKFITDPDSPSSDENIKNRIFSSLAKKYGLEKIAEEIIQKEENKESLIQSLVGQAEKSKLLEESLSKFSKVVPNTTTRGEIVQETLDRLAAIKKWRSNQPYVEDETGDFDVITYSKQIKLLAERRVIFNLAMFQNSTKMGKDQHKLIVKDDALHFRSEGKWINVDFLSTLEWDPVEKRNYVMTEKGEKQRWNYLSQPGNEGFVPFDDIYDLEEPRLPEHNNAMKPSGKISEEELKILQKHAEKFDYPNPTNEKRDCIFQVVSHPPRPYVNGYMDNFNKEFPNHVYFRLIDNEGNLYSTGTIGSRETLKGLKSPRNFFSSGVVHAGVLDTDESRKHSGRITTTIPISEESSKLLLKYLSEFRQEGRRFNVIKQNCVKTTLLCLKKINVIDDKKMDAMTTTIAAKLSNIIPSHKSFGMVGTSYKYVSETGKVITKSVTERTPQCVIYAFECLRKLVMWTPMTITYFLTNLLVLAFGGMNKVNDPDISGEDEDMKSFDQIIKSVWDLFRRKTQIIYDSTKITEWMLKQPTTIATHYDKPSLNLFPQDHDDELMDVYKDRYHIEEPTF